jgi:hypothetical protein
MTLDGPKNQSILLRIAPATPQFHKAATDKDFVLKHAPQDRSLTARYLLVSALIETASGVSFFWKITLEGSSIRKSGFIPNHAPCHLSQKNEFPAVQRSQVNRLIHRTSALTR